MAVYGESLAMPEDNGFGLQDGWSSRLKSVFSSRKVEVPEVDHIAHTGHHSSPKPEVTLGGIIINQGVIPHTKRNGQIDESHPGYDINVYKTVALLAAEEQAAAILAAKQL
jgi:hypothetical protein